MGKKLINILKKAFSKTYVIGRFTITFNVSAGISKGGYLHIPLLNIGIGSNGFGLSVLGLYFGVAWTKNVR